MDVSSGSAVTSVLHVTSPDCVMPASSRLGTDSLALSAPVRELWIAGAGAERLRRLYPGRWRFATSSSHASSVSNWRSPSRTIIAASELADVSLITASKEIGRAHV